MWNRFDDAMDDLEDELYELRNEIRELEAGLERIGEPVPPEEPLELDEVSNDDYMNDRYQNEWAKVLWHRRRKKQLEEALCKAEGTSTR